MRNTESFAVAKQLWIWYLTLPYIHSDGLKGPGICAGVLVASIPPLIYLSITKYAHYCKVAVDRTYPNGRVIGIDVIPAQPPKGVSTIQGNFLSPAVQEEVKRFLRESDRGRTRKQASLSAGNGEGQMTQDDLEWSSRSYIELEKRAPPNISDDTYSLEHFAHPPKTSEDDLEGRMVDAVLSDMSEPWAQTEGFWKRSLSDPYFRMMNTSGMSFRDHAGSMVKRSGNAALHNWLTTYISGSVQCRITLCLRYLANRGPFCLQILSRL